MALASSFLLQQYCSRFEGYVHSYSACPLFIDFYAAAATTEKKIRVQREG
jgi:hypothetical protein